MNIEKPRLPEIDILKSLAITLVIFYHVSNITFTTQPDLNYCCTYFLYSLCSVGVPLFFFCNGYLLFSKELNIKALVFKLLKIIFITSFWGIVALSIFSLCGEIDFSFHKFNQLVLIPDATIVGYLWFMGTLFQIYLIFPLLKVAFQHAQSIFYYFIIILFTLTFGESVLNHGLSVAGYLVLHKTNMNYHLFLGMYNPTHYTYAFCIIYFALGGIAREYKDKILQHLTTSKKYFCILLLFVSAIALTIMGYILSCANQTLWDTTFDGYNSIFTLLNVCLLYLLIVPLKKLPRICTVISKNTLGMYLIHPIIRIPLNKYIPQNNLGIYFLCALAITGISLAISIIIKKIPGIRNLLLM